MLCLSSSKLKYEESRECGVIAVRTKDHPLPDRFDTMRDGFPPALNDECDHSRFKVDAIFVLFGNARRIGL